MTSYTLLKVIKSHLLYDITKVRLKDLLIAHLTDGDTVSHSDTGTANPQHLLEIEKVELEALKLKLQFELAERESTKLKIQQQEIDREQQERDREERTTQRIREERLLENERAEQERERQHELQLLQLTHNVNTIEGNDKYDVAKHIKLIPSFSESNPEAFLGVRINCLTLQVAQGALGMVS